MSDQDNSFHCSPDDPLFLENGIENRIEYLAPHKEAFESAKNYEKYIKANLKASEITLNQELLAEEYGKEIDPLKIKAAKKEYTKTKKKLGVAEKKSANILIDLLKIEPSFLIEPWILYEIIGWMRNEKKIGFLTKAFIEQKNRNRLTTSQRAERVKDDFFYQKISEMITIEGFKEYGAFKELANQQNKKPNICYPIAEGSIQKKWYKLKKKINQTERSLPYPFFGLDFHFGLDLNYNDSEIHEESMNVEIENKPFGSSD